jgi:HEAT repeat protein
VTLADAAAQADSLAQQEAQTELAKLRSQWDEELESAARSSDYRERAVAYRAIGQFRFRQKLELLRRGLQDESPACRGSALLALELLSRDHPGDINADRPLLHSLVSDPEENPAVRRLAVICLKNGSPQRDTIVILEGLAGDDEADRELRAAAKRVAELLKKKGR